ncbi:ATP synthase subunit I [Sutcliffiella cohnii]|uniref:ATP synthase subunit I n=1 Tax=Sutcliffiella cohnii TaxID=33932 RepID=UPI002E1FF0D3|nr:ATP synthase subunit I [Sutcliffiella cohnii]
MPDSKIMFFRHIRYFIFLFTLYVLGWGFTPYQEWFLGLLLGTVISFYNHWLLYKKVNKLGKIAAEGGKMMAVGTVTRMAAAVLVVLLALRLPEYLNQYGVIFGIMTSYIVIIIDSFATIFISNGEER